MATYYVELVRPAYPSKRKLDFNVHKAKDFSRDVLSPGMTAVFQVDCVQSSTEAVTCVMEYAAGFRPQVRLIYGGKAIELPKPTSATVKFPVH